MVLKIGRTQRAIDLDCVVGAVSDLRGRVSGGVAVIDIDAMQAGRELDVLIAEKVMRLKAVHHNNVIGSLTYDLQPGVKRILPHYSTDIADAWRVAEKIHIHTIRQIANDIPDAAPLWSAEIYYDNPGVGDTAPLAICRAALKAVLP